MSPDRGTPQISVVMPAYRRADELGRALDALAAQTLDHRRFEVIVVDDGSPETLLPVVDAHAASLPVRHVRHERNLGRAAARNTGAREAAGEFLLFLDADMIAVPALLAAHLGAHAGSPGERLTVLGPIPVAPGYESALGRYMERRGHMRPDVDPARVPHRYFVSANTSFRSDLFRAAGGYDERFVHYGGEDIDLGWKLGHAGSRFVLAPEAIAHHAYRYNIVAGAARMREFGRRTLPLVFTVHPELVDVFHLDLVTSRGAVVGSFFRLVSASPLLAAGAALARLGLGRLAPPILSYVLVGNYFRGYLEHLSSGDGEAGATARSW